MNFVKIVCDRSYAKNIKELGINQDSIFCWAPFKSIGGKLFATDTGEYNVVLNNEELKKYEYPNVYSAFTASEIFEMLPKKIWNNKGNIYPIIEYGYRVSHRDGFSFVDIKICNALAKMLIHLLTRNIISYNDVNAEVDE